MTFSLQVISYFPCGSDGKASAYNAGDLGSIPGSGRSPGEEMATHSSILAWKIPWMEETGRAIVHWVTKSWTQLSDFTFTLRSLSINFIFGALKNVETKQTCNSFRDLSLITNLHSDVLMNL